MSLCKILVYVVLHMQIVVNMETMHTPVKNYLKIKKSLKQNPLYYTDMMDYVYLLLDSCS